MGCEVCYHLDEVLPRCDVVNVLRIQFERQQGGLFPSIGEYSQFYMMTQERLRLAKSDLLLLAPGPVNRGVELTPEVADGKHSAILDQVTNGLAVRMAVLYLLSGGMGAKAPVPIGATIELRHESGRSATREASRNHKHDGKRQGLTGMGEEAVRTIQITGGRIIDPSQDIDEIGDLWISRGRILPSGTGYEDAEIVIDAQGHDRVPGVDRRSRASSRARQ